MTDRLSDVFSPAIVEAIERLVDERVASNGGAAGSPWLDAAGAADYLAVPVKRIRNLTAAKEIPHVREGGRVFFHRGQLDAWRLAQSSGPRFPVAASKMPPTTEMPRQRVQRSGAGQGG